MVILRYFELLNKSLQILINQQQKLKKKEQKNKAWSMWTSLAKQAMLTSITQCRDFQRNPRGFDFLVVFCQISILAFACIVSPKH